MFSLPQTAVRYVHETVARDAARRRRERELHDLQRAQLLPLLASGEHQRDVQTMQSAALALSGAHHATAATGHPWKRAPDQPEWLDATSVGSVRPELRFEHVGGAPVPLRASIVRLPLFKLIGSGAAALLTAAGSSDPFAVKTCAFAAAVNLVAVLHYYAIWQLRLQNIAGGALTAFMVRIRGRGDAEQETQYLNLNKEAAENAGKLFAQEIAVDSLRSSDWAVTVRARATGHGATHVHTHIYTHRQLSPWTFRLPSQLVLLYIDLHAVAQKVNNPSAPGEFLPSHWGSAFQAFVVFLGSLTRFLCNNLRPLENTGDHSARPLPRNGWLVAIGILSFVAATAVWVVSIVNLLDMVGLPDDAIDAQSREDCWFVRLVVYVQLGYPAIAIAEIVWLNFFSTDLRDEPGVDGRNAMTGLPTSAPKRNKRRMPGSQMDPVLSLVKDVGYGTLDTLSKGGVAVYLVLRAAQNS